MNPIVEHAPKQTEKNCPTVVSNEPKRQITAMRDTCAEKCHMLASLGLEPSNKKDDHRDQKTQIRRYVTRQTILKFRRMLK